MSDAPSSEAEPSEAGPSEAGPSEAEPAEQAGEHSADEHAATLVNLVHDLNQPLTAMTNFLAAAQIALANANEPATIAALLDDATAQAARARAVVHRMRVFLAR